MYGPPAAPGEQFSTPPAPTRVSIASGHLAPALDYKEGCLERRHIQGGRCTQRIFPGDTVENEPWFQILSSLVYADKTQDLLTQTPLLFLYFSISILPSHTDGAEYIYWVLSESLNVDKWVKDWQDQVKLWYQITPQLAYSLFICTLICRGNKNTCLIQLNIII